MEGVGAAPWAPTLTPTHRPHPQLTTKEGGLTGEAIVRGAYVNTGSRDVGRDPQAGRHRSQATLAANEH